MVPKKMRKHGVAVFGQARVRTRGGHEATDTGLAYAPVSQAHGHHHTQFNVLPCCTAAQTRQGEGGGGTGPCHMCYQTIASGAGARILLSSMGPSLALGQHLAMAAGPHSSAQRQNGSAKWSAGGFVAGALQQEHIDLRSTICHGVL